MSIIITSKKDGFRRAGLPHPAQATSYPDDRFSPAELAALQAEPLLVVQVVEDPAAEQQAEDEPGAKAQGAKAKKESR
ncbi:HI1506-related protein [Desulfocurvus vexinensis]|uniref:HI1506-related protein n=1 Tax=Desulfocurvus vexinensis TaxID=399548 RepID=UPI0004B5DACF|nr:HI1506-related protein [Desulfocurvus vexinensis]